MAPQDEKDGGQIDKRPPTGDKGPVGSPADLVKSIGALVTAICGGTGAVTMGPPTDVPVLTTALAITVPAITWLLASVVSSRVGRRVSERAFRRRCVLTGFAGLIVLILTVIAYFLAREELTAPYADERRIVGTELTERGAPLAREKGYSAQQLLMAAGGDARAVWTAASLRWSAIILWTTFILLLGAVVFPVIFLWYARPHHPRPEGAA